MHRKQLNIVRQQRCPLVRPVATSRQLHALLVHGKCVDNLPSLKQIADDQVDAFGLIQGALPEKLKEWCFHGNGEEAPELCNGVGG